MSTYVDTANVTTAKPPNIIPIWESRLILLSDNQRLTFGIIVGILLVWSVIGNILTIFVNIKRQTRLLFRMCLLSLSTSDLIYCLVTSTNSLAQFYNQRSVLWILGEACCKFLPFLQMLSCLVTSISLVTIAMDRYMVIVRMRKSEWKPERILCITCAILIWGFSAGVSSSMLSIYDYIEVYIVIKDPLSDQGIMDYFPSFICGCNKEENAYYFATMFCFNFLPITITFLWLCCVVTRKVHLKDETKDLDDYTDPYSMTKTLPARRSVAQSKTVATIEEDSKSKSQIATEIDHFKAERMKQLKLCRVMLLLLGTFLLLRFPTAIYLLYRIHNHDEGNVYWVIHYAFGALSLVDTAIRPIIYIFLSESVDLKEVFQKLFGYFVCPVFKKTVK